MGARYIAPIRAQQRHLKCTMMPPNPLYHILDALSMGTFPTFLPENTPYGSNIQRISRVSVPESRSPGSGHTPVPL